MGLNDVEYMRTQLAVKRKPFAGVMLSPVSSPTSRLDQESIYVGLVMLETGRATATTSPGRMLGAGRTRWPVQGDALVGDG